MQPMDIYIADVPFDEGNGSKIRPALVTEVTAKKVIVLKITSKYNLNSEKIKQFYYPIKDWQAAGLNKKSYVDIHRGYHLPAEKVFARKPLGKLTDLDRVGLYDFFQKQIEK
ncbi:type II toxin-antitoxin system PemK/MazF family toxin [Lactobacillus sp. ESL0791]|uniref:type II toxin-antitoxin system PemK/MazF family toxin n=1 Tax=Lactobacillus sp. ESL0791 TaxID=2983234 RepID=UPI0023F67554|nr:type II toxin-antitoxin system PemK/MazF family toxin [Lactobacillus sp. ESL0791]MDF7639765.1 type II toxin-antitoxin system PemK/MazF family toxin [Lactobacillus sp. ESL0791]